MVPSHRLEAESEEPSAVVRALQERVKELTCLHSAARVLENHGRSTEEWLDEWIELLPASMQHPHLASCRIRVGELERVSEGFEPTLWMMRSTLVDSAGREGFIEIAYSAPGSNGDSLFLHEERSLLDSLGEMLRVAVDRRLAEEALVASETRYRHVVEHQSEFIVRWLPDGTRTLVNEAYARFFGTTVAECVGTSFLHLIPESEHEKIRQKVLSVTPETPVAWDEHPTLLPDGTIGWSEWSDRGIFDENGRLVELQSVGRDTTERKRAALALAENEERLRQEKQFVDGLMDSLPGIVLLIEPPNRLKRWNRVAMETCGLSPEAMTDTPALQLFATKDQAVVRDALLSVIASGSHAFEGCFRSGSGKEIAHLCRAVAVETEAGKCVLVVCMDISERRALEEQFRQAQKMEAIGHLAGGVAHDFNNLLMVICGYSSLLLEHAGPDDPDRTALENICKAGEHASSLTRQLLAFSRQTVLQPVVLELNDSVAETEKMLRRVIGEDIDLTVRLGSDLDRIKVDPGQLSQVLMNLAVNARDAMPEGGTLTIETSNREIDEGYCRQHPYAKPGDFVELALSDSGCGMAAEVLSHIFEPFYTTKSAGKGTGLGLATAYGIVKQSGGHIEVYSEVGIGTTFRLYFPAVTDRAEKASSARTAVATGSETILLVEDQEEVRKLAVLALETYGYRVLVAANGEAAVKLYAAYRDEIGLLVTDVVMPGMSGRRVAEALRTEAPDLPVLFVSGYTDDAVVRHGLLHEEVDFLQKPYSPLTFVKRVREILDRANS